MGLCKVVVKGGTFWRPVRFGTCGELQWIGRVGGQKGRGPLERCAPCQTALSECLVRVPLGRARAKGGVEDY